MSSNASTGGAPVVRVGGADLDYYHTQLGNHTMRFDFRTGRAWILEVVGSGSSVKANWVEVQGGEAQ